LCSYGVDCGDIVRVWRRRRVARAANYDECLESLHIEVAKIGQHRHIEQIPSRGPANKCDQFRSSQLIESEALDFDCRKVFAEGMLQRFSLRRQDWDSIEKVDVHLKETPKPGRVRVAHQLMRHGITLLFGLDLVSRTRSKFFDLSQEFRPPSPRLGGVGGAHKVQIDVY
jgi:hypothetical protein